MNIYLLPTLNSVFINCVARLLKDSDHGFQIGDECLQLLMYADDIVVLDGTFEGMQAQHDIFREWSLQWG